MVIKYTFMSALQQLDRKDILSDPSTAFSRHRSEPDESEIVALEALGQRWQSLQNQHRTIKESTGILSREIGRAKRNNEPVDDLLTSMQALSAQLKSVKTELAGLENQIIGYFTPDDVSNAAAESSSCVHSTRSYADKQKNSRRVAIMTLGDAKQEWNAYVTTNPASSIYHRTEWRELLEQTYGLESHYLLARYDDSTIAGILPQIRLKSRLFGDYLVSMPYFMRGGAIADQPSIERELILAANDYAARQGVEHIEYRDDIAHTDLPVRTDKVHMVLQLPESHDQLWQQFTAKLRSQIRRPQRVNPQLHFGGVEYLDDFYSVYARNMRDLGSPAHSKRLIQNILRSFPANSWIITLKLDDKPVAAGLLLQHGGNMDIPLASTIREVNPLGINMLMYWEILKFSIDRGCTQFDFGRSSKDSGTYRFKQQWGAKPKQLYLHYWLNEGNNIPSLNPSNPKYAALIYIWKRLPVELTKWIGPRVVNKLP